MTTDQVVAEQRARPLPARLDRVVAWTLLAGLVLLYAGAIVLGERETSMSSLREGIASGDVTEVRTSQGLGEGSIGYTGVLIRWERHGVTHRTSVMQASGERQARRAREGNDSTPVVVGDVADHLTTNGRTVRVVGTAESHHGSSTEVLGLAVPLPFSFAHLGIVCATLLLIGAGEPWRATRWAWAWLVVLTPIGVPAFLLLGGATGLFAPRMPHRRLTAGWAFLLALVLFGTSH